MALPTEKFASSIFLPPVEYHKPQTVWGELWIILEKIFLPLQAALLALAIRRKFMRGCLKFIRYDFYFTNYVYSHNIQLGMKSILENVEGFEWDEGNSNKNWHLHSVTNGECEDVFFNLPLIIAADKQHSEHEIRFFALGRTESNRWLFLAFTLRNKLVRVISAREMTKSERKKYYEKIKRDTEI